MVTRMILLESRFQAFSFAKARKMLVVYISNPQGVKLQLLKYENVSFFQTSREIRPCLVCKVFITHYSILITHHSLLLVPHHGSV